MGPPQAWNTPHAGGWLNRACRRPARTARVWISSPDGIRTHATAVRGRRPRPLDDGARTDPRCQHSSPAYGPPNYLWWRNFAGVPGLEPRMAEPESAVLPITPYPIGCLKRLVRGFPADATRWCGTAANRCGPTCRLPNKLLASHVRPTRSRPSRSHCDCGGIVVQRYRAERMRPTS